MGSAAVEAYSLGFALVGLQAPGPITSGGKVVFHGTACGSLSTAAARARGSVIGRGSDGRYPPTNGWTFWRVRGGDGSLLSLDQLRRQGGVLQQCLRRERQLVREAAQPEQARPVGAQGKEYAQALANAGLLIASVDGTGVKTLASFDGEPGSVGGPTWSPDGGHIAYATFNGI
jgi:hypothetical protein